MITGLLFSVLAGLGRPQTAANRGYYMQPTIHGNDIVFVSQGDLWQASTEGGEAHALTGHVAPASSPAISPDGRSVAFSGTYEGPRDAYVMPLDGDLPKRITFENGVDVRGWTPDGKVLVSSAAHATLPDAQLRLVDPQTRKESPVPLSQASEGSYDATGKSLYFTRLRFQGSNTKRYEGGTAQGIWKYTDGAAEAVNLTKSYIGTNRNPMWWSGRVYFLSDRDGVMNLWSMDGDGGSLKQLTHHANWDIQSASLDAGKVVYQMGADLRIFDIAKNEDKALEITLASDFEGTRDRWQKNPMSFMTSFDGSPDGSKIAITARGQVFVAPVEPGRFVEVSRKPGARFRSAIFSKDGKFVFTLSDQTGETEWWKLPANGIGAGEQITQGSKVLNMGGAISPDGKRLAYYNKNQELLVVDLATKAITKIATSLDDVISDFAWSPDSQWLAYNFPTLTFSRIYLYSFVSGKSTAVTSERSDATSPTWSPDGSWLYFISTRTFNSSVPGPWGNRAPEPYFDKQAKIYSLALQAGLKSPFMAPDELTVTPKPPAAPPKPAVPTKVELDGLPARLFEVPVPAGNYRKVVCGTDRLFVADASSPGVSPLLSIEIKDKDIAAKTLVPDIDGDFVLSADDKHLIFQHDNRFTVVSATASSVGPADKPVDLSGWNFAVQPREEWRQMYNEAWRLERDYFYDPGLLSVDWNAIHKKYEPLVDRVRDRSELSNVLAQMIGELSTLHMFVYGGDNRRAPDAVGFGELGGEFVKDGPGYRITKIYQGDPDYPEKLSPLSRPGVDLQVGDAILSVNGTEAGASLNALLRGQQGRQVLLHVLAKDGKERDCIVKPMSEGEFGDLRYTDWEYSRRIATESAGHGDIGYLHLRAMGSGDIATFERDFYPNVQRSGLIIDVRHNGGGNIDSWILEKLMRKAWMYWQPRVGHPYWNMQEAFRGHVVVLCDEFTGSDGEAFTEGIKRLGIGKVIGTRTWGGEVWLSSSNFLGDGGIATAAEYGVYGPEGKWLIEGHGVDPDFTVDNLPHATFMGKDAQLEAAIAYLAKEIKDKPIPVPPAPKYPNKGFTPKKAG